MLLVVLRHVAVRPIEELAAGLQPVLLEHLPDLQADLSVAGMTCLPPRAPDSRRDRVDVLGHALDDLRGLVGGVLGDDRRERSYVVCDYGLRLGLIRSDHLTRKLERILEELEALQPDVAIIDSIQALHDGDLSSAPGSVAQVRECAAALQRVAKRQNTALLLVGHVTKEGVLAGPKVLEHLVDAVLTFEGDRFASHRLLRAVKNRFGATHELGVFEMRGQGLAEVGNPSELFLSGERASGVATIVACEGTRPLVVDLQALVSTTSYSSPRRTATGIAVNRLHQILAVLEKHMGLPLSRFDCYLAVAGGLDVEEPAADLGVAAAVVASYRDLTLPAGTVLLGELGLGGQLRPVGQLELRLQEAVRLGFTRAVVPKGSGLGPLAARLDLALLEAGSITEALVLGLGVNPGDDD